MTDASVLVTGCSGFLGSQFVRALTRRGDAVVELDALKGSSIARSLRVSRAAPGPRVQLMVGDN
jgi:nucleoside-diphosphate-sugar epimerase